MTQVRQKGCDVAALAVSIDAIKMAFPTARLVRNAIGNLMVLMDEEFVGYLDLTEGGFYPAQEVSHHDS